MKRLFARRGFRLLLVGQGVSALGDWMGTVAFMVLVHDLTGSSTAVAGVLVLRLVPAALAGPLTAKAVSRWDRRRTMQAMDLVRTAMVALVPLVRALWWIYLWAFLVEVAGLVFLPARDSSIPDLVGDADLPLANGLVLGSSYGTIPLGAGAFALVAAIPLFHHGGVAGRPLSVVFWVDAATYLVSLAMVSRLGELARTREDTRAVAAAEPGFRDAFRLPLVAAVMPAAATAAVGIGTLFSLGIVFVQNVLGATDAQFGVLIALFGVGAAVGLALLRVARRPDVVLVRRTVGVQGLVIAGMSLAPGVGLTFLGAAAFGATTAAVLATGMSILQDSLDGTDRVLAFAAFHVVIRAGLSLAAIAAGVAADVLRSVHWPVVGTLPAVRVVLFVSGLVVTASSFVRIGPAARREGRRRAAANVPATES